ncbi:hypothetical protein QUF64_12805 [Anaerolineales bacterium HSG6]|nr:hypothetical protein [Anaerolineales bacterium HSG6]
MDYSKRVYYEAIFKSYCHEKKMNEFQDFFSSIMETRYPGDFIRVRPWGKNGDRKNDGFLTSKGALFQVYAPKNLESKKAAKKIVEDFEGTKDFKGAKDHWSRDMKQWVFVHNGFDGLGPEGTAQILDIQQRYPRIDIQTWGPAILQKELFGLEEEDIAHLLRIPILTSNDMMQVGYKDVQIIIDAIAQKIPDTQSEIIPVPEDKIELNGLSPEVENHLNLGVQRSQRVGEFFRNSTNPELGDKIAEAFNQEYVRLKSENLSPDKIYWKLFIFAGGGTRGPDIRHEASVLAVLAYFFERCDIFESSKNQ